MAQDWRVAAWEERVEKILGNSDRGSSAPLSCQRESELNNRIDSPLATSKTISLQNLASWNEERTPEEPQIKKTGIGHKKKKESERGYSGGTIWATGTQHLKLNRNKRRGKERKGLPSDKRDEGLILFGTGRKGSLSC